MLMQLKIQKHWLALVRLIPVLMQRQILVCVMLGIRWHLMVTADNALRDIIKILLEMEIVHSVLTEKQQTELVLRMLVVVIALQDMDGQMGIVLHAQEILSAPPAVGVQIVTQGQQTIAIHNVHVIQMHIKSLKPI